LSLRLFIAALLYRRNRQWFGRGLFLFALVSLVNMAGCASTATVPETSTSFLERKQTQVIGEIRLSVAVPSATESRKLFGGSLYAQGVQPLWLEIDNGSDAGIFFLPIGTDPLYFSPTQSAYLASLDADKRDPEALERRFYQSSKGLRVPSGQSLSGFVFTALDEGTKAFNVDLISDELQAYSFTFFVPVPGLKLDHSEVNWDEIYSEDAWQQINDDKTLIEALERMPCCTSDKKGEDQGDPLNIVVIGEVDHVYRAFLRASWDETETIHAGSLWKTAKSFFSGGDYRYSPVSGLYVFGRAQDVAFQWTRENIHERNHLRLWLTPLRYRGTPVWIGQISRDIGVRFTTRTVTTHKVDPDVDETREYLLENLAYSQALRAIGYVQGVGEAAMDSPRANLTGDPYFTDGYRVVLWVASTPTDIAEIKVLPWRQPPLPSSPD
jgi:hypothetical protein